MLLNFSTVQNHLPYQRIIWLKVSLVLRLRNLGQDHVCNTIVEYKMMLKMSLLFCFQFHKKVGWALCHSVRNLKEMG